MKEQIEEKTRIPKEQQHLVSRGKVLKDMRMIDDYNMNGKEIIDLTVVLLGGMKRDAFRPTSKTEEREAKRKASEPCLDVCGFEESKNTPNASEEKWKE